jgi:hypothetical protein
MINMTKSIKAVCIYDKAIDHSRVSQETILEYIHTRDLAIIEPYINQRERPVYYHVKRIPRSVMLQKIMPMGTENERAIKCFQYCIEQVENMPNDAGGTLTWKPTEKRDDIGFVSEEELDRFDLCDVLEIGTMAWYLSFLRRANGDELAAPPTSLDILVRRGLRSARRNQTNAHQSNSKPPTKEHSQPSEQTVPMPETDDARSVPRMVASAEGNG